MEVTLCSLVSFEASNLILCDEEVMKVRANRAVELIRKFSYLSYTMKKRKRQIEEVAADS